MNNVENYRPFIDFQQWIRRAANSQKGIFLPRGRDVSAHTLGVIFKDEITERLRREIQQQKIKAYKAREKVLVSALVDIGEELEERGITLEPEPIVTAPAVPSTTVTTDSPASAPASDAAGPAKKNWVLPASILALFLLG